MGKKLKYFVSVLCFLLMLVPGTVVSGASANITSYTMQTDSEMQFWLNGSIRKGKWKSSNTKIATVSDKGYVRTKSTAGKTVISVRLGGTLYKCNLTVIKEKLGIKINKKSITLDGYSDKFKLKASTNSKRKLYYMTSNPSVARISAKGVITPVRNGTCEIVVTVNDYSLRQKTCKVTVKNCPAPAPQKSKYSYEVYVLDPLGADGWFMDQTRPIYIKTDNPNMDSVDIFNDDFDLFGASTNVGGYADLDYSQMDDGKWTHKVPGGYVKFILFSRRTDAPSYTGYITITENEKPVKNIRCTVQNTYYLEKQMIKKIADIASKQGSTPFDKMQAAVDYIESKHPRYYTNDGMNMYQYATDISESLWFYTWRFDSLDTPTILCAIAKEIGGFDKISNLYYDGDWSEHWYAEVTVGNEKRRYTFCPFSGSGYVENPTAKKIDFNNTAKFIKVG